MDDEAASLSAPTKVGDVVRESIPAFLKENLVISKIFSWLFESKRLLRPSRQSAAAATTRNPRACRIMVQVIRGQNIPTKVDGNQLEGSASAIWADVSFMGSRRRTSTQTGSNPSWNELLELPLKKPNDDFGYSPAEMLAISSSIHVNVYDRHERTEQADHTSYGTVHHWEEQWLGSVEIPFSAVYLCRPVYAAFPLSIPSQSLGYKLQNPSAPSRLWFYVTLDPPLPLPFGYRIGQPASEHPRSWWQTSEFHKYCWSWLKKLRRYTDGYDSNVPRHVSILASDFKGEPVLCCRFVRALAPPEELEEAAAFTRFVSSIPFQSDNTKSRGDRAVDCWCTNEQFLTLGWGDDEEHALLLCSYFLHREEQLRSKQSKQQQKQQQQDSSSKDQKKQTTAQDPPEGDARLRWKTYVCCATSITGLATYWVARIGPAPGGDNAAHTHSHSHAAAHKRRVLLYDPVEGVRYDAYRDRKVIPLKSVGALFNADNIWANIQEASEPWFVEFDLQNATHWMPLFTKFKTKAQYPPDLTACIQPPLPYVKIQKSYFETRAADIERIVEQRFERWRTLPTTWDYGVAGVLRGCLQGLEEAEVASGMQGGARLVNESKGIERVKKIYKGIQGFPLRFKDSPDMKYIEDSEENPIVERVRETRLHDRRQAGNRFALAVYIHPYPNSIGSCWVYIAALPPEGGSRSRRRVGTTARF